MVANLRAARRHVFDELFEVAGIWHDKTDWAHIWPAALTETSLGSADKQAAAVSRIFGAIEDLAQVRLMP